MSVPAVSRAYREVINYLKYNDDHAQTRAGAVEEARSDRVAIQGGNTSATVVTPTGSATAAALADLLSGVAPLLLNPNPSGPAAPATYTAGPDGASRASLRAGRSQVTATQLYAGLYPGVRHDDTIQAVADIAAGSTITHAAAVAGYAITRVAQDGVGERNGVALFGLGVAQAAGSAVWGLNPLVSDREIYAAGTDTAFRALCGAELDFNVMFPGTGVTGVLLIGASLTNPASSNAVVVAPLGLPFGTAISWGSGFSTGDAAASYLLAGGLAALSGANVPSQPILLNSTDGAGTRRNVNVQAIFGALLNLTGSAPSVGYAINGTQVLGPRRTGWSVPTGTQTRTALSGSPTLAEVAERVNALIFDGMSSGWIGP